LTNIVVPELGESVVEARVARWLKKEGDHVQVGEALVSLETEKVDVEVSAEKAGVLTSIKHKEGADVKVGELLATVDENMGSNGAKGSRGAEGSGSKGAKGSEPAVPLAPEPVAPVAPLAPVEPETRATPTARRIAKDNDVKLGDVAGSGSAGRVMKDDVRQAISGATGAKGPAPGLPAVARSAKAGDRTETRTRMTKRRATIARRLVEAQQTAAMLTTFNEVDMSAVMAIRAKHKESFKEHHGVGLGLTSFFVKASVAALKLFPLLNAEIQGDEIVEKHFYDIGIAVGAEGGLVVPVLRDAGQLSFADIELSVRDFATRANNGSLTLDDLSGGTFTITNGGVFGSLMSTPILNPPQVGILGLHKIADRAVPIDGQVVIRPMMYLALSYDHRIVDGREAVQFLVKVKEFIEDPSHLLLS
jgi:2-oxoglutarate dehydrogenase E2 component (dihydrolipoamide succinyltransferase)